MDVLSRVSPSLILYLFIDNHAEHNYMLCILVGIELSSDQMSRLLLMNAANLILSFAFEEYLLLL
jgi:hypothetical protein